MEKEEHIQKENSRPPVYLVAWSYEAFILSKQFTQNT